MTTALVFTGGAVFGFLAAATVWVCLRPRPDKKRTLRGVWNYPMGADWEGDK